MIYSANILSELSPVVGVASVYRRKIKDQENNVYCRTKLIISLFLKHINNK